MAEGPAAQQAISAGAAAAPSSPTAARYPPSAVRPYAKLRSTDSAVVDELQRLEESFENFTDMFWLLDKIGEGTFSCVYKAVDLSRDKFDRTWEQHVWRQPRTAEADPHVYEPLTLDSDNSETDLPAEPAEHEEHGYAVDAAEVHGDRIDLSTATASSLDPIKSGQELALSQDMGALEKGRTRTGPLPLVAVKRIHVTSSPTRIANELEILSTLANSPLVSHVITALRDRDQVVIVMQYVAHTDFRAFYATCSTRTIRGYMSELLAGLEYVHSFNIIHRDMKPTNFLYDLRSGHGVIVDFGLAEFQQADGSCPCREGGWANTAYAQAPLQQGHRRDDQRPGRRANRAGTRGFRAPEVLFKCNAQTTKIDMWSAGVTLLIFLSRKFPFFNSMDDSEALVEIATLFGRNKMRRVALQHGSMFETSLPTIRENGHHLNHIINWANDRRHDDPHDTHPQAIDLLAGLLEPDFQRRLSAGDALRHPFFTQPGDPL